MGTDRDSLSWPCLCGNGTIEVEQSSPDHSWVKSHQVSYSASLNCATCSETMFIRGTYNKPELLNVADVARHEKAKTALKEADKEFSLSELALQLKSQIVRLVDGEQTMAAKHRMLTRLGLSSGSLATYRRNPVGGLRATEHIGGSTLARIGATTEFGGLQQEQFAEALANLTSLLNAELAATARPVKTGIPWLRA